MIFADASIPSTISFLIVFFCLLLSFLKRIKMDVISNLKHIIHELPPRVKLIAVSKTHPENEILKVYNAGHKIFGENKAQELITKYEKLPGDIEWHMIGHLQSNKVKYIAPFVSLIHSVDSGHLLSTINKEAIKNNRIVDCLLQLKIAREESKYGLTMEDTIVLLKSDEYNLMQNVRIVGLMGMATFTDDENLVKQEFEYLVKCFQKIKEKYFNEKTYFCELSMGMSGDYKLAIAAGSTMVRIGSLIFGERNYQ